MTSANVFNWAAGGFEQTLNANAVAAEKPEVFKGLVSFASMMNVNYTAADTASARMADMGMTKVQPSEAFNRYQYRDNTIGESRVPTLEEKMQSASEELEKFADEVTKIVAEELDVPEEKVIEAMEVLGLTAYDLLEPQNLVKLSMELTGAQGSAELLVNSQFVDLMQEVDALGSELAADIGVQKKELVAGANELIQTADMDALTAQMEVPDEPIPFVGTEFEAVMEQAVNVSEPGVDELNVNVHEADEHEVNGQTEAASTQPQPELTGTEELAATESQELAAGKNLAVTEAIDTGMEAADDGKVTDVTEKVTDVMYENEGEEASKAESVNVKDENSDEQEDFLQDRKPDTGRFDTARHTMPGRHAHMRSDMNAGMQTFGQSFDFGTVTGTPMTETSYMSVDTLDIIRQIAENVKVSVSEGTSSMEMQLNPENLGKVYLHISSQEGVIHAQIAAANEAVRSALEVQAATLRENLNQAGVKVDAIEVTIASHEFERNLEQGQSGQERGDDGREFKHRRRNLKLSSLDELSGLMSEEEMLLARIMRENGNSVDLSA